MNVTHLYFYDKMDIRLFYFNVANLQYFWEKFHVLNLPPSTIWIFFWNSPIFFIVKITDPLMHDGNKGSNYFSKPTVKRCRFFNYVML